MPLSSGNNHVQRLNGFRFRRRLHFVCRMRRQAHHAMRTLRFPDVGHGERISPELLA
jgi:hypothetical protein